MTLRLRATHTRQVHAHLCRRYPEEGCGVLLGRDDDGGRHVERVVPVGNEQAESRANRYLISPEAFLRADREARAAGLDVIGFYHSHPDHPARPSAFDLEHAWPYYSYVIASVDGGQVREMTAWRLEDDRSGFNKEEIELLPDSTGAASGDPT